MRNANLTQSFFYLSGVSTACLHISSSWDPGRPLEACALFSVDSTPGLGVRRTLEQSCSFVLREKVA